MPENRSEYEKQRDTIQRDFAQRSAIYDDYIVKVVPYHREMLEAFVDGIPFSTDKPLKIVELGCGTGLATESISKKYPDARIKCIDMSSHMLDLAKKRFDGSPDIEFMLADYTEYDLDEPCDAVISFLSLMYLADDEVRVSVLKKAYDMLASGGVFVSGEVNISRNKHYQDICMEKWMQHMRKSYSDDFIESEVLDKAKRHGSPSALTDELQYLEDLGFRQIDLIWKYYGFSVYAAIK